MNCYLNSLKRIIIANNSLFRGSTKRFTSVSHFYFDYRKKYLHSVVITSYRRMSDNKLDKKTPKRETNKKNKRSSRSKNYRSPGSRNITNTSNTQSSSDKFPVYLHGNRNSGKKQLNDSDFETQFKNPAENLKKHENKGKLPEIKFEKYISEEECMEGLKRGELMQGVIRVNPKDYNDSFITSTIVGDRDIYLEGMSARNRALPGDIVAVKILPQDQWKTSLTKEKTTQEVISKLKNALEESNSRDNTEKNGDVQTNLTKTGKVVYIIEKKHPRITTGHLNIYRNNSFGFALMSPIDNRLPRLMISLSEVPEDFRKRPKDYEKTLFVGQVSNWNLNMAFAAGKLVRSLGEAGHIEPETEAILINNDIDSSPFSQDVLKCLPNGDTWSISQEEIDKRRDLRRECIFTVDPPTARDLDDALSCIKLDDDHYRVGVHIADVSFFIEQGNTLDKEASKRATSVYLSQKVIPMLPAVLCEQLCSLNPGVDRLAYSVIWKLGKDGTVLEEWFGRTVIRSCVKLSYNHAQQMIDTDNHSDLPVDEFPQINGNFDLSNVAERVKTLYGISKHLRNRRFDSGALRLDQPKLSFTLDDKSGNPNGFGVYEYRDSNRMIEEFMLLANMAVAHRIYKSNPKRAILRCHPPPHPIMMEDLSQLCAQYNIPFDITNSLSISNSLTKICEHIEGGEMILPALILMCTKPFQNAKYFCTGSVEDESVYHHYALNVPIYTHFTSPIRRYPDILVHRFLTNSLDKTFEVKGEIDELQAIANICNDKKTAAKKASEQSAELFFNVYVMECGPLHEKGVVVGILDKAVDVLCVRIGIVKRVYCEQLSLYKYEHEIELLKPRLTLYWRDDKKIQKENETKDLKERIAALTVQFEKKWATQNGENEDEVPDDAIAQTLTMFSPVDVCLSVQRNAPTKLSALIKSPFDEEMLQVLM